MARATRLTILAALGAAPFLLAAVARAPQPCAPDDGGLRLADGFCATLFAEEADAPRQIALGADGVLYAALGSRRGAAGVVALRDADGDGRAEQRNAWGPGGANDVELRDGYLYLAYPDRIVRWRLAPDGMRPAGDTEVVVGGLPADRSHAAKSLLFGAGDTMFVNIGSPSNSCQGEDRAKGSPGLLPCPELETRAGLWAFSASRTGQGARDGTRYATGLRNAMALAREPGSGALFAATHGRDQLSASWGFGDAYNAENPAEEFMRVAQGDDFGWPYCYHSHETGGKVLAPEYGGDGKQVGRCAGVKPAALAFPGHWAPMAIAFGNAAVGAGYADGAFVAFHGSWNRAPLPQQGYRVVFAPFRDGAPTGEFRTFAIGRDGETGIRPAGVAVAADGAVYVASDRPGRVWRVTRRTP